MRTQQEPLRPEESKEYAHTREIAQVAQAILGTQTSTEKVRENGRRVLEQSDE